MDIGLNKVVRKLVEECKEKYELDYMTIRDRRLAIMFVHNYLMSLMPVDLCSVHKNVIEGLAEVFGVKSRAIRFTLRENTTEYSRAAYVIKEWTSNYFDAGTFHNTRPLEWYERQQIMLRKTGMIGKDNIWKNLRYADRLKHTGKSVMIVKRDGAKIRIAQDGGLNEWNIVELMGEDVINDQQEDKERD